MAVRFCLEMADFRGSLSCCGAQSELGSYVQSRYQPRR